MAAIDAMDSIEQKIFAGSLYEEARQGSRTHLLHFRPGAPHGPFKSNGGCVLFEMHYFDPAERGIRPAQGLLPIPSGFDPADRSNRRSAPR